MAIYATEENGRLEYTKRTLYSLLETVDFNKHRLGLYLNSPCDEAIYEINVFQDRFTDLYGDTLIIKANPENVGTAKAVNCIMAERRQGELCIKMDDDVIVNKVGWIDEMEEVIARMPQIGVLGLKRRDLEESPNSTNDWYKSKYYEVPHERGERVFVVERCQHIMGTCTMFSEAALERVGALYQPGTYAFDDSLYSFRCSMVGLWNCFLIGVDIEHIDRGGNDYTKWKQEYAGEKMEEYQKTIERYKSGELAVFKAIEC